MVFGVSAIVILLIYWVGGRVSAKGTPGAEKVMPYACGENLPAEESRVDLERFLVYALYFLIFDVISFVIVTSFYITGIVPAMYSLIALLAVAVLILSRRHR